MSPLNGIRHLTDADAMIKEKGGLSNGEGQLGND